MKILAKLFSWLFVPLAAPVYALLIACFVPTTASGLFSIDNLFDYDIRIKTFLLLLFFIFSVGFPVLMLGYFKVTGVVSSWELERKEERRFPAVSVLASAITLYVFLYKLDEKDTFPYVLFALALGSLIGVISSGLITFVWKISLHGTGMGLLTGFVFMYYKEMDIYYVEILPGVILLSGLVLSMRYYLKAHNLSQLFAGYFLGFLSMIIGFIIHQY